MARHTRTFIRFATHLARLAVWRKFADLSCSRSNGRAVSGCSILSITVVILATLSATQTTVARADAYRYKQPDGSVLFTDIKLSPGEVKTASISSLGARRSYRGSYGRPTATASCSGIGSNTLEQRYRSVADAMEAAASEHDLDPLLLRAVARVESCYDTQAVSIAGAEGIMQLMPATARELAVSNSFNASANINGAARYLAWLRDRYNGNTELMLAAYNAGPGAVDKHGGIPPYRETIRYVPAVIGHFETFKRAAPSGSLAKQ